MAAGLEDPHRKATSRAGAPQARPRGYDGGSGHEAGTVLLDNPRIAVQAAARVRRNP